MNDATMTTVRMARPAGAANDNCVSATVPHYLADGMRVRATRTAPRRGGSAAGLFSDDSATPSPAYRARLQARAVRS